MDPRSQEESEQPESTTAPGEVPAGAPGAPWPVGKVLLGDFQIDRILGQGGMGTVYRVRNLHFDVPPLAVKTLLPGALRSERLRRQFLRELRTWIDLPQHPHLTRCHFFRTVEDRLSIFAEFVEAGSLKDWIRQERLNTLEAVLDVAIQVGWGLEAAHARGVIHQDVKPANVLMTSDGIAKLTDFGLSGVLHSLEVPERSMAGESGVVTSRGLTPAYCSPEQAAHARLGPATDLWSWGILVLEMLNGGVSWMSGTLALLVLQDLLSDPERGPAGPVPHDLVGLLERCFRPEPADRGSMEQAVADLKGIYLRATGTEYPRQPPSAVCPAAPRTAARPLPFLQGKPIDPVEELRAARIAEGREQEAPPVLDPTLSRRGRLLTGLEMLDEVREIYQDFVERGDAGMRASLARIEHYRAHVLSSLGDGPGAFRALDRSIQLARQELEEAPEVGLRRSVTRLLSDKGLLLGRHGRLPQALEAFDEALKALEAETPSDRDPEARFMLSMLQMNKAMVVNDLGDLEEELSLYGRALALAEQLREQEGSEAHLNHLGNVYMNMAGAYARMGELRQAIRVTDEAIRIYQRLSRGTLDPRGEPGSEFDTTEHRSSLARVLCNRALLQDMVRAEAKALAWYDRSIAILEGLVYEEERHGLRSELATAVMNRGILHWNLEDSAAGIEDLDRSIRMWRMLVLDEGRGELAFELARAILNRGWLSMEEDEPEEAARFLEEAIRILETLVHDKGQEVHRSTLAVAHRVRGMTNQSAGDPAAALVSYGRAAEIFRSLVEEDGRRELRGELAHVGVLRARALFTEGRIEEARAILAESRPVIERELERSGHRELRNALQEARRLAEDLG